MDKPLPFDETKEGLEGLYREKYGCGLPDRLVAAVDKMKNFAETSHLGPAKDLESFAKEMVKEKLVKMFCYDVPDGILPSGYSAVLHDIKVDARGPDDKIYGAHPEIRRMVARGTTTMQLNGPESWYDVIIYANKKFTGGIGDEDDTQINNDDIWREYCLEPPENAEEVICMEKLNGDAVHFTGRFIGGRFYIFAGSKNTHMVIRNKEDIDLYQGDRYNVARRFAVTAVDTLEKLDPRVRHLLYSFLHHTKTTAICEVLQPDYQHIVDLSYLEENQLNLISFTPTASSEKETTLTAFPPHHALELGNALGLHCAPYHIIKPEKMMEQRNKIRDYMYKEGEVLYYVNSEGETFGIAKAKSVWYIILRALREKMVHAFIGSKKKPDWNLEDRIKSINKRLNEIQKWLKLSERCIQSWKNLGESFARWMEKELKAKKMDTKEIRPKFPVIWKRFLAETEQSDSIPL